MLVGRGHMPAFPATDDESMRALDFFDVGSVNLSYADVRGNIALFMSGEMTAATLTGGAI